MPNSCASSRAETASGSMLPPCPFTTSSFRKPSARIERTTQRSTAWKVAWSRLTVPPKGKWCSERPIHIGGSTATGVPARSAARTASAWAQKLSVQTGRCGPCCSRLPTGSTTSASCAATATPTLTRE
jgi:hypothetical protein